MFKIRIGDTIIFKGGGPLRGTLAPILKLFEPHWDMWGWHMAKVIDVVPDKKEQYDGVTVLEAVFPRVRTNTLNNINTEFRVYHVFTKKLNKERLSTFVEERAGHYDSQGNWILGSKYDALVYVFTTIQHIFIRVFKTRIPRLVNDSYSCWELAAEFDDCFGKPWISEYCIEHKYPLITDFLVTIGAQS